MTPEEARGAVLTMADLENTGQSVRDVRGRLRAGDLVRVHPGWFVEKSRWDAAYPEDRHLLRVAASDRSRRGGAAVASHCSAAVLHGLPLTRVALDRVHLSGASTNGRVRRAKTIAHHEVAVAAADLAEVGGIRCTTLARTVFDVIRTTARETAVTVFDAALRQIAWDEELRAYDEAAAEVWREQLRSRLATAAGARGIRQARWVLDFADGQADRPGESISRIYLADLGYARPRLQVPFPGPRGGTYRIDFGLDDVDAWGEFDGEGKYFDPEMLGDRTTAEAMLAEKEREDWIRARSGRRVVRWGWKHITTSTSLADHLAAMGLRAP